MAVRLLQRGLDAQLVVHQQLQRLGQVSVQLLHLHGAAASQLLLLCLGRQKAQSAHAAPQTLGKISRLHFYTTLTEPSARLWTFLLGALFFA